MKILIKQTKVDDLLNCFLSGRNQRTLDAYRTDLEDFKTALGETHLNVAVSKFISLTPGDANAAVLRYRNALLDKGLQSATINRRLAAIRSLLKMARMIGIITWGIEIPNLKIEVYRDTRGPGIHIFLKMIEVAQNQAEGKAKRDVAILRLLYDLALRASEIIQLNIEDYCAASRTLAVSGKGKRSKVLMSIPQSSVSALNDWISLHSITEGPIFINFNRANRGGRLTRQGLYQIVNTTGRKVGVDTRPHGIRHLSITEACKVAQAAGYGLEEVLDHSRHASVTTLMIYRDRERNVQEQIASLIATKVDLLLLRK